MKKGKDEIDLLKVIFGIDRKKSKLGKLVDIGFLLCMIVLTCYLWFVEKPKAELEMEIVRMRNKEIEKYENLNLNFNFTMNNTKINDSDCPPCICLNQLPVAIK